MNEGMGQSQPPAHLAGCPGSSGEDPVDLSSCPACRLEGEWVRLAGEVLATEGDLAEAEAERITVASVLRAAKSGPALPPLTVDPGPRKVLRGWPVARLWKPAAAALASAAALLVALDLRNPEAPIPSSPASLEPAAPVASAPSPALSPGETTARKAGPLSAASPGPGTPGASVEPSGEPKLATRSTKPTAGGTPVEFRIEKDSDLVRLTWESRPGERFRVARCPLKPDGPVCARWVTIDGDSWTDSAPADDLVVVYRIERVG